MDTAQHASICRPVFEFGAFRLDPIRRTLRHGGDAIPLQGRSFDMLQCLAEHAGEIVGRDELMHAVWGGRIVDDANLKQTAYLLRRSLRPYGGEALITAVPTRGYRLGTTVRLATESPRAERRRLGRWPVALAAGTLALIAGAAALFFPGRSAPPPNSIAVMPLAARGSTPAQNGVAEAMAVELIGAFGRAPDLRVAAESSSAALAGARLSAVEIGRRLNVATLLEGSITSDTAGSHLTLQLVSTATGYAVWTFAGALGADLPNEARSLAAAIAGRMGVAFPPANSAAKHGSTNNAALDAYLRGLAAANGPDDPVRHEQARSGFALAIAADPGFAEAHAALSQELAAHAAFAAGNDAGTVAAELARARGEAAQAIALAPDLAAAHRAASRALLYSGDYAGAAREIATARAQSPSDPLIRADEAVLDQALGHIDKAEEEARDVAARDPLTPGVFIALADAQCAAGHDDAALQSVSRARLLGAGREAAMAEAMIDFKRGDNASAKLQCAAVGGWQQHACLAIANAREGRMVAADAERRALEHLVGSSGAFQYAEIEAQSGNVERALQWLQTAAAVHDPGLSKLRTDPMLDPLRSAPGFSAVERVAGLGPIQ